MRTRTKASPIGQHSWTRTFSSGSGAPLLIGPFVSSSDVTTMTDVVTPGYLSRIREGAVIVNPMSYSRVYRESSGSGFQSAVSLPDGSISWTATGAITEANSPPYNLAPSLGEGTKALNAVSQAKLSAIANIDKSAIESGEDLLELRQTLMLLRNPIGGILNNLRKIARSRGRSKAVSVYDLLSEGWLQYRFGFSPLIRSIHSILSEIETPTKAPPTRRVAHGRSSVSLRGTTQPTVVVGGVQYNVFSFEKTFESSYHATVVYEKLNPIADFRWRYGLRNKDIPKTFWNVVPLSFMVDRVFDISSAISAAVALSDPSVRIVASSITSRETTVLSTRMVSQTQDGWSLGVEGNTITDGTFNFRRSTWNPSFADTLPNFRPQNLVKDLTSIADLVTIVTQMLR